MNATAALSAALRGLTVRGWSFLASGATAGFVSVALGQRDVFRVAVLLVGLPLVCAVLIARTRYRLSCERHLQPTRVAAGSTARVRLRIGNESRLPTGLLFVEDSVPYELGSRPRMVIDRLPPQAHRVVGYDLHPETRGRYAVGPLQLRLADPFGLCELRRSFPSTDSLTVTPPVVDLPHMPLPGRWSGSGESRAQSLAAAGEDDVATREYRHGDPLHRVHWRSTARYGELMVRREERLRQSRCTLVLDTRARSYDERGDSFRSRESGGDLPAFERAVAAAASIGVHLVRRGYAVRLVTDTGATVSAPAEPEQPGQDSEGELLDALAVLDPSQEAVSGGLRAGLWRGTDSLVVLVVGRISPEDAEDLRRISSSSAGVAVLVPPAAGTHDADPEGEAHHAADESAVLLRGAGWRVVPIHLSGDLASAWSTLSQPAAPMRSPESAPAGARS